MSGFIGGASNLPNDDTVRRKIILGTLKERNKTQAQKGCRIVSTV
jgi:hypothetical protein